MSSWVKSVLYCPYWAEYPKGNQEYFLYLIGPGAEPGAAEVIDKNRKEF